MEEQEDELKVHEGDLQICWLRPTGCLETSVTTSGNGTKAWASERVKASSLFMSFIHKNYICAVVSYYNLRTTGWRDYRRPSCDFSRAAMAREALRLLASLIDGDAEEDVKIFVRLLRVLLRRSRVKRRRSRSSVS